MQVTGSAEQLSGSTSVVELIECSNELGACTRYIEPGKADPFFSKRLTACYRPFCLASQEFRQIIWLQSQFPEIQPQ
jgi:hypothetical protein